MKLYLYAMKNRLSGVFEKPITEKFDEKEYPELLAQSLALAPIDALLTHKEFDVYKVGEYESKSGEISNCEVSFVMSLESICTQYIEHKKGESYVREESRSEERA